VFRRTYASDPADPVVDRYDDVAEGPVAGSMPWSPAQIIGLIVGIGFAVLGIAAIVRTGFDTSHVYTPHTVVWKLPHSPLLALCEIVFGALMIIASVVPGGLRTLMGLLGAIALVFGVVILAGSTPTRLVHWFAVSDRNGWLFTIVGAVVVLASIVSPVFFSGTQHRRVRHVRTLA
jgi:hypothetical protein